MATRLPPLHRDPRSEVSASTSLMNFLIIPRSLPLVPLSRLSPIKGSVVVCLSTTLSPLSALCSMGAGVLVTLCAQHLGHLLAWMRYSDKWISEWVMGLGEQSKGIYARLRGRKDIPEGMA